MNDDMNDTAEPTMTGDSEGDSPAVMGRAVRAARDLLATLAESGEGVSLVTILTKAVLENRMARERDAAPTAAPAAHAPTPPEPEPGPDAPDDGDPFMRGAPDPAPRAGAGIGRKTDPPGNTEPVDDSTAGDTVPDDTAADDAAADGPGPAVVRADAPPDPETEERYDAQMGARVARTETFYPNLVAFVECFLAHVFPFHQSASSHIQWVPDWWRHPALVFPLDAIWRSYETSRRSPGQDDLVHPGLLDARPRVRQGPRHRRVDRHGDDHHGQGRTIAVRTAKPRMAGADRGHAVRAQTPARGRFR